jgi:hypothetical protein
VALEDLTVGRQGGGPAEAAAEPDPETALLRLRRVFVDLEWRDLFSRRVHLRELAIEGPALRVERDAEGRIDPLGPPPPSEEAAPEPSPPEPSATGPAEPWGFALDRFDLRELELRLVDLATGQTPVEFSLAGFALSDVSVAGPELGLGGIEIQSPALRVDRDFAFAPPTGAPAPAGETPAPAEPGGEPLAYRIERIGIADAAFTLRTDGGPIDVSIRLAAEKVSARSRELFPVDLELGIGAGKLALRGQVGLNPLAYQGRLAYSDLALPPLSVAARPELGEWVRSCRAEGDFAVDFRSARAGDTPAGLRLSGAARIHELLLSDPKGEEVSVGWRELEIAARELFVPLPAEGEAPGPVRVALERVRLVEPDVVYTLPARQLDALLRGGEAGPAPAAADEPAPAEEPAATGATEPEPGAPAVELTLDAFELAGGRVHFRDRSVSPPFEARVRDLAIGVEHAGFPDPRAKRVRATGIIPETASFSLDGGLEPASGKLRFDLERLALPAFDPYAAGAGYRLARGEVSLRSEVRVRGSRTQADNRIVLHRLDVSSKDAGDFEKRFGMPLDLALALLRDPQGDIRLEIPVVLDESGARTELATVVAGALRQALVGALSSPLKLVGAVLPEGGGDASFAPLAALPGQAGPTPDAEQRLDPLAKLLGSRPALGLRLAGRAGPVDRPLVAERILAERAAAGEDWPEVEGSGFLARRRLVQALEARGRGERAELSAEDEALLARTAAAVEVPPARLRELARERAEAVRDALVAQHGVDAVRLAIEEPAGEGDPGVVIALAAAPVASPTAASVR